MSSWLTDENTIYQLTPSGQLYWHADVIAEGADRASEQEVASITNLMSYSRDLYERLEALVELVFDEQRSHRTHGQDALSSARELLEEIRSA